ncbi:MAG: hypothetical protein P0Y64_17565 [Candidatus Sphingomonas colombiensis]|nr:hypothetical protein [Sphingomonas sp.]WEK43114.1 MAG: hypothetical protein P0Y64_17565 [Sphingomonas sp.]
MTIDANLAASVRAAGDVMRPARDPWWIISSAAVALHGADAGQVGDVDVLLSVNDAEHLLPRLGLKLERGSDHPDFRSSIFGNWTEPPLHIEFMAGFCYRSGTDWLPVLPETREAIKLGEATVFVPSRGELLEILHSFGRPKDMERAARLLALGSSVSQHHIP